MEKQKLNTTISSLGFIISFFACQFASIVFLLIGVTICSFLNLDSNVFISFIENPYGYLLNVAVFDLTMVLIFILFNRKKDNKIISKPNTKKIFLYILIAIISFFALTPIVNCIDTLLIKLGIPLNTISYELDTPAYIISIFSLVLFPAICEELLFRGLIFKGLKENGKAFSILISSIMFSLYHMSFEQTLYPILIGMLLGVIMYNENNILYTIIVHAVNNFLSLTLSYLNISLVFNHWTYILLAVILFCIYLGIILYFTLRKNKGSAIKLSNNEKLYLYLSLVIMIIIYIIINFNRL